MMAETSTLEASESTIDPRLRVLVVTSEWPRFPGDSSGIFTCRQVDTIRLLGNEVEVFAFRGKKNPVRYLHALIRLRKEIRKGYDVLHAHHGQAGLLAVLSGHGKVVVTFHGSDVHGMRNRKGRTTIAGFILRSISRYVASRAGCAIVVAGNMKAKLPARKYYTIPCGVNTTIFKPYPMSESRRILGLPQDVLLVLFVSDPKRIEKRFWLAQEAVKLVSQRIHCELIVADGIPSDMMPRYLSACDVLLLTSLSEGSPTIVKEAIVCNLPVVSVDVGDVSDRIAKIDGCRLCTSDEPADIATELEKVLRSRSRIDGRQFVDKLDERALSLKVLKVYHLLLRDKE
jgi:glycosyltransferase involved in cell wall biosynthesis